MSAFQDLTTRLAAQGCIGPEDVRALRGLVFGEIEVTPEEISGLVRLDEQLSKIAPEWGMMFAEAVTDFVVRQREPSGHVDEAGADWLIRAFSRDGRTRASTEIEALVKVLETAESAPARLAAFALRLVKNAVLADGRVTAAEVERVRRVIYAFAGAGVSGVTREEAEALFDINDAVRGRDNDPAWAELFAKAVASSVLTGAFYTPATADQAEDREAWLRSRGEIIRGMPRILGRSTSRRPSRRTSSSRPGSNAKPACAPRRPPRATSPRTKHTGWSSG